MRRITVRGGFRDICVFIGHIRERNRRFKNPGKELPFPAPMNLLSRALHPPKLDLSVSEMRRENESTRTYRLVSRDPGLVLPPFRAGQYLSVSQEIRGNRFSRPYSLSCAPSEALRGNYYEITVKDYEDGFFAPFIIRNWVPGTEVAASAPAGLFYLEPLRDTEKVLCLAGGCGITPFRSILPEELERNPSLEITLLYGIVHGGDLLWEDFFRNLETKYGDRFRFIPVCSRDDPSWQGRRGFLSAELIREVLGNLAETTLFVSGPPGMHRYLGKELSLLGIPQGRVHTEFSGSPGPSQGEGPAEELCTITLLQWGEPERRIPSDPKETVLSALERAGVDPPSLCRIGTCGFCRAKLISGRVSAEEGSNLHIRGADRKFGYFHPCSSFPRSDLVVRIPKNKP